MARVQQPRHDVAAWPFRQALIFLLLLAAPAAGQSVPVEAELHVAGSGAFHGTVTGTGTATGVEHRAEQESHGLVLEANARSGRYEYWDYPFLRIHTSGEGPAGYNDHEFFQNGELLEEGELHGRVSITGDVQQHGLIRAKATAAPWPVTLESHGSLVMQDITAWDDRREGLDTIENDLQRHRDAIWPEAAGPWQPNGTPTLTATGGMLIFSYGATVQTSAGSFVTGQHDDALQQGDPLAWTRTSWHHRYVLFIWLDAAEATFSSTGTDEWTLLMQGFDGHWIGDLALATSEGEGHANGTRFPEKQGLVQIIGDFNASADFSRIPSVWQIEGNASFVAVDAITVAGLRPTGFDPTLAAAATAGLLFLLWLFLTKHGQAFLGFLLNRRGALDHELRVQILRLIGTMNGAPTAHIRAAFEIPKTTLRYHLLKLNSAGLIQSTRRGGREYNFLRGLPTSAPGTGNIAGALKKPIRREAARIVRQAKTLLANDILSAWNTAEAPLPSPRLLRQHLRRMERRGILRCRMEGRNLVCEWVENDSPPQMALLNQDLKDTLDLFGSRAMTEDEAIAGTARPARLQERIRLLYAYGFLDWDRDGKYYARQPTEMPRPPTDPEHFGSTFRK